MSWPCQLLGFEGLCSCQVGSVDSRAPASFPGERSRQSVHVFGPILKEYGKPVWPSIGADAGASRPVVGSLGAYCGAPAIQTPCCSELPPTPDSDAKSCNVVTAHWITTPPYPMRNAGSGRGPGRSLAAAQMGRSLATARNAQQMSSGEPLRSTVEIGEGGPFLCSGFWVQI